MSEPYTLPSRACCWAGNVAFPYPCPWHPPGEAEHRDWHPIGASIDSETFGWSRYEDDIDIDAPSAPARDDADGGR